MMEHLEDITEKWDPKKLMEGSEPCSLFKDVNEEIQREQSKRVIVNEHQHEKDITWDYLANKPVGYDL